MATGKVSADQGSTDSPRDILHDIRECRLVLHNIPLSTLQAVRLPFHGCSVLAFSTCSIRNVKDEACCKASQQNIARSYSNIEWLSICPPGSNRSVTASSQFPQFF